MKITVWGAGAIGGTIGAYLTQAGYDVTLVDVVPEHVQAMNEKGLRIEGKRGDHTFPVKAKLASEVTGPLETVFLCVKGHFTDQAMQQIAPLLAPDGYVVSIQNGLNEDIIARHVGRERTVGCFVHFGADYIAPGLIQFSNERTIFLGELDGSITDRVKTVQSVLSHVMPVEITTNIWGYLWGKLVYAAMAFGVSSVDAPVYDVLQDPRGRRVSLAAASEAAQVAKAQGYQLEMIGEFNPNAFVPHPGWQEEANASLDALGGAMEHAIKNHMGIWMDLKIKRRKTEVDMQCVPIAEKGREFGIATPVIDAIIRVVHQIENGERGMGWENLDELDAAVPSGVLAD